MGAFVSRSVPRVLSTESKEILSQSAETVGRDLMARGADSVKQQLLAASEKSKDKINEFGEMDMVAALEEIFG